MLSLARIADRLRDESGIALVVALGIMIVFGLTTAAMIEYTSAGSRTASVSRSYSVAQALAEAGVNDAQARLNDPANNAMSGSLLSPATGGVPCPDGANTCFETAYDGGTTRWFGVLDAAASRWTITSWGVTPNPTGSAQPVQRRLRVATPLVANPTQPNNATAWNYVLATQASDSTTCDVTISNNAIVDVNFYVQGNLCMSNNAEVLEPDHDRPVELIVHGKLQMSNNANVGADEGNRIAQAKIGGGCARRITDDGHLCTTDDEFFVGEYTQLPTQITAPVPDYAGWYDGARPGPRSPCTTSSGVVPTWDNDTTLNLATAGSAPTFDLTPPTTSYSCRVESGGVTVGELSWNHLTKTLTTRGVIYYDGSMTASGETIVYDGSATIHLTGTLNMSNNTKICAAKVGSDCDFEGWNPGTEMLIFVVNGGSAADSVTMTNNVRFQGGILAQRRVNLSNNVHLEGPMIAERYELSNNVVLRPLPTITDLPLGAPGNPNTHASPSAPRYE